MRAFLFSSFLLAGCNDPGSGIEGNGGPNVFTVERIKHCRHDNIICNDVISRDEYAVWERAGVPDTQQKWTFLARLSAPPKNRVKYLAFFAAGQQAFNFSGIYDNCFDGACGNTNLITGQEENWKKSFVKNKVLWKKDFPRTTSLVTEVLGDGPEHVFPVDDTFAIAAWDNQFNHELGAGTKQNMENAYYDYLKGKIDPEVLRVIYLAGHSRGGCLSMRLAKRFNDEFPHIPVIVHSFDGVCTADQGELGTRHQQIDNPASSRGYEGYATSLADQYSQETSLFALHLAGGAPVIAGILDVHTFSEACATEHRSSYYWLAQEWFDVPHEYMEESAQRQRALDHLRFHKERVDCAPGLVWGTQGCEVPDCPVGGVFDGAHCYLDTPSGHTASIQEGELFWSAGPSCPIGTYETPNCLVSEVPDGSLAFVYENSLYYSGQRTCPRGEFDSAHCFLGMIPDGRSGFMYAGNLYYTDDGSNTCPLPGSSFDGANCFVAAEAEKPFLWNGGLYIEPLDNGCPVAGSSFDGANCFVATAPEGTTPLVLDNRLYVTPRMDACPEPSSFDGSQCLLGRPESGAFEKDGDLYYDERPTDPPLPPIAQGESLVRLHHVKSDRCTFAHLGGGDSYSGPFDLAYATACGEGREQLFVKRPRGGGLFEFRHLTTGACLKLDSADGADAFFGDCNTAGSRFSIDPTPSGHVRLRHQSANRCLYASPADGGTSRGWSCWDDPNQEYVLQSANLARGATVEASSTASGHSVSRVTDGEHSALGHWAISWVNASSESDGGLPQTLTFRFGDSSQISQVIVSMPTSSPVQDYDVEVEEEGHYRRMVRNQDNTAPRVVNEFPAVKADAVRLVFRKGGPSSPNEAWVNEVEVY